MENKNWDFDRWAQTYDQSVCDGNWIHQRYDETLRLVADKVVDRVKRRSQTSMLDIGAGTGNLESLLAGVKGLEITAIEPSAKMRERFLEKHPCIELLDGNIPDNLPAFETKFDIITSTYVIHHVPFGDLEKLIDRLCSLTGNDGEIILVDPMFETSRFREEHVRMLKENDQTELAQEIEDEFFHSVAELVANLEQFGFEVQTQRITFYVWMIHAKRDFQI